MGFPSCQSDHARHCHGADRRSDPPHKGRQPAGPGRAPPGNRLRRLGLVAALWAALGQPLAAEPLRLATWSIDLSAKGPGLTLAELTAAKSDRVQAVAKVLIALDADVLLLTDIDYDAQGLALAALNGLLPGDKGYGLLVPLRGNTGVPTGLDLNGDGALNGPDDALAWGRFPGEGGMALMSRLPLSGPPIDLGGILWADLPGNRMTETDPALRQLLPLSRSGHWILSLQLADGQLLHLLAYAATPPLDDLPAGRNIRRNHDESALWLRLLEGRLPSPPPPTPLVILGKPNRDPEKGGGLPDAMAALLSHPLLSDPQPKGALGTDTAEFAGTGPLRVDMVLPSRDIAVLGAGVLPSSPQDPLAAIVRRASRHFPVWLDIDP